MNVDETLRDEITERVFKRWGWFADGFGIHRVPIASRTVLSVDTVMGLVKNGGFSHLLEDTLSGDEDLKHAIAAFQRIGSGQASKIILDIMSELQTSVSTRSSEGRYKKYLSMPKDWRDVHDVEFWGADAEVEAKLTQFIHDNRDLIEKELALPKHWTSD